MDHGFQCPEIITHMGITIIHEQRTIIIDPLRHYNNTCLKLF